FPGNKNDDGSLASPGGVGEVGCVTRRARVVAWGFAGRVAFGDADRRGPVVEREYDLAQLHTQAVLKSARIERSVLVLSQSVARLPAIALACAASRTSRGHEQK